MNLQRAVVASMSCLALACVVDEGPEDLDTTESLLCSDGAADATVAFSPTGSAYAISTLPTNSYQHPDCSDRFTVEVTGVSQATQPFDVWGTWGEPLPKTQVGCELAFANIQTHEYKMTWSCSGQLCFPAYGWHQVGGDIFLRGTWLKHLDNHYCVLIPDSPLPTLQPNAFRIKARVAIRAYAWALFFPVNKRGAAGVAP